jgi:hypothetical protein
LQNGCQTEFSSGTARGSRITRARFFYWISGQRGVTNANRKTPWFSGFQQTYGAQGFAVVGVSMDEGGWRVLRPFLAEIHVPYRILLGNDATGESYGILSLPDTFLIDRHGRIAAAYQARLVDKDELETSIKALLAEK